MRPVVLIVGILVIIAGVVLAEVPFDQSGSKTVTAASPGHFHISQHVPVVPSEPVSLSWSSSTPVTVAILSCSSINLNASSIWAECTGGSNQTQTGTSGTVSTTVPSSGGYLWVGLITTAGSGASPTVSASIKTPIPSGALALWVVGALIVVVGVLLRGRKRRAPSAGVPAPAAGEAPAEVPSGAPPPAAPPPRPPSAPAEEEEEPLE